MTIIQETVLTQLYVHRVQSTLWRCNCRLFTCQMQSCPVHSGLRLFSRPLERQVSLGDDGDDDVYTMHTCQSCTTGATQKGETPAGDTFGTSQTTGETLTVKEFCCLSACDLYGLIRMLFVVVQECGRREKMTRSRMTLCLRYQTFILDFWSEHFMANVSLAEWPTMWETEQKTLPSSLTELYRQQLHLNGILFGHCWWWWWCHWLILSPAADGPYQQPWAVEPDRGTERMEKTNTVGPVALYGTTSTCWGGGGRIPICFFQCVFPSCFVPLRPWRGQPLLPAHGWLQRSVWSKLHQGALWLVDTSADTDAIAVWQGQFSLSLSLC